MTQKKHNAERIHLDTLRTALTEEVDGLKPLVQEVLQQVREAEMEECVGAGKSERTRDAHQLPLRPLPARVGDAGWPDRVTGAAGSPGPLPPRVVRALPTE